MKKPIINTGTFIGTPGAIRTHDLWYRKPTLYPAELRVHICDQVVNRSILALYSLADWLDRATLLFYRLRLGS
jgi:hypothetical protein